MHLLQNVRAHPTFYQNPNVVSDLNGKVLFEGLGRDLPFKYITWVESLRYQSNDPRTSYYFMNEIGVEFSRWLRIPVIKFGPVRSSDNNRYIDQYWRYMPEKEIFVGYDSSGRCVGYAGANGIQQTPEKAESLGLVQFMLAWWPLHSRSPMLLWVTEDKLYQLNFSKKSVETIFEMGRQKITMLSMGNGKPIELGSDPTKIIDFTTVDGTRRIISYDKGKKIITKLSAGSSIGGTIGSDDGKLFLRKRGAEGDDVRPAIGKQEQWKQWMEKYRYRPYKRWEDIYEITPAGKTRLLKHYEWMAPVGKRWIQTASLKSKVRKKVMAVSTPLYSLVWWYYYHENKRTQWGKMSKNEREFVRILGELTPRVVWTNLILSLLMVGLALWHGWARRTSWAKFTFWMLFVAAFNLAGLLTYLAINHTVTIRCPVCDKKRSLQRQSCRACNAPLPEPKRRDVDLILSISE